MTAARPGVRFTFLAFTFLLASSACAQSDPVALRRADASIFGGVTRIYTGLSGGHDGAVTAGLDLNLPEIFRVRPSLEVRATAPFDRGTVDRQKDILGGFRLETRLGRLHPYVDLLGGRGQITFNGSISPSPGRPSPASHPPTSSPLASERASTSARSSPSSPTLNSSVGAPPHPSPATSSPNPSPSASATASPTAAATRSHPTADIAREGTVGSSTDPHNVSGRPPTGRAGFQTPP